MTPNYQLPLTQPERELLARLAAAEPDLAGRVDLVLVENGWVTLSLTEAELWSLYRVACLAREDLEEALRAAASRMNRVLSGGPALPDPERGPAEPAPVLDEVDIPLTAADRVFLRSHPEWLEDLPPALARRMSGEGSRPVRVLEVSEADASTLFDLKHRIKAALGRVARRGPQCHGAFPGLLPAGAGGFPPEDPCCATTVRVGVPPRQA